MSARASGLRGRLALRADEVALTVEDAAVVEVVAAAVGQRRADVEAQADLLGFLEDEAAVPTRRSSAEALASSAAR